MVNPSALRGMLCRVACLLALAGFWCAGALRAEEPDPFESALTRADLDMGACRAYQGDEARPVTKPGGMLYALGLAHGDDRYWTAGNARNSGEITFRYLVVLKRPTAIGSMIVSRPQRSSNGGEVYYMKPTATGAPDGLKADQWEKILFPGGQASCRLATFSNDFTARAFLFVDRRGGGRSELSVWRLLKRRLFSVTGRASAHANAEYTAYLRMTPPRRSAASGIVTGSGHWQNAGPNQDGKIFSPPVSDLNPSWFTLSWEQPQRLAGLFLLDNFEKIEPEVFRGPATMNPVVGLDKEWRRLRDYAERRHGGRWISFEPVTTRGVRIKIIKTDPRHEQIARIDAMLALVDLGDAPIPKAIVKDEHPPLRIEYDLPEDGIGTCVINDSKGRRVRNLLARDERGKGPNTDYWDLKDEHGLYVPPGTYQWTALFHPPLQLRYAMTPYPNIVDNSPENSPWLNGESGPGGWLADHTPNRSVCTAGDRVWFGSPNAESGVAMIECDLTGRKLWGHHNFAAWTGPSFLAMDGKTIYAAAPGWSGGRWRVNETVWAIDIATKQVTTVLEQTSTYLRKRGMAGLAARDGKLYISTRVPANWLTNATSSDDVDLMNCAPKYAAMKKTNKYYEPNPRDDFVRLFRLRATPAGQNGGLTWLESTKGQARRQHIVLAFNKPVPIGTLAFPFPEQRGITLKLSILKKDAKYPPEPRAEADWDVFWTGKKPGWCVVPAPKGALTRALRVTFIEGDERMADIEAIELGEGKTDIGGFDLKDTGGKKRNLWGARVEGMKILRRRFAGLFPTAKVRVNSGRVDERGEWDARRRDPVSESAPGIYALQWDAPQTMRGLAIKEIDGKRTEIDVYTGDGAAPIDIESDAHWERIASYEQKLRYYRRPDPYYNGDARYVDGYVDFGRDVKTRAVRLRVVEQWTTRAEGRAGCVGVREDRGGRDLDPTRCRVYGVNPVSYLGGEVPVDPLICERVEVYDTATRKVTAEQHLPQAGAVALNPSGDLFTISGHQIVRVDFTDGKHETLISDLERPTTFDFDQAGNAYVYDAAPERNCVRVYDPKGAFLRTIGTPGGFKVGPWDPTRMEFVRDMAIDKDGQMWLVEFNFWPKRITLWGIDGTFKREFLGNTAYGGGGALHPYDKTRLFYGPMEFALDWERHRTRLKNLTWRGDSAPGEIPIRIDGRTYLVTKIETTGDRPQCGVVYLYEKDHLRRVAAMGLANFFAPLNRPDIKALLGRKVLADFQFVWSDLDGDGNVQPGEVTFSPKRITGTSMFDRTLGVQAGDFRYEVKKFLPNGVPVYEEKHCPQMPDELGMRLSDGNYFFMARGAGDFVLTPEGKQVWRYPTEGRGVHALYRATPYQPSQVVAEFEVIGCETAHAGDLGEFLVTNTNVGTWHVWTSDGLLAARIFRDIRDPARGAWSMREHQPGLRLENVTAGQEHFSGYFCKTFEDNRYYVVAGHNHASVVEVVGLDKFKRLGQKLEIKPDLLRRTQAWEHTRQRRKAFEEARLIDCRPTTRKILIDGDASEWDFVSARIDPTGPTKTQDDNDILFRMACDPNYLYLCYEIRNNGPLKNTGNEWRRYFKSGAAVDLQMATSPGADPGRKDPVAGDVRLLMTIVNGQPRAVLYRPVMPGTPEHKAWKVATMVYHVSFDQVVLLPDVQMAHSGDDNGYVLEARVPLKSLGLKITPNLRLKMDWGILVSGRDGNEVMRRIYWSNKATSIVSDEAAESMLHPDLWGYVRFLGEKKGLLKTAPGGLLAPEGATKDDEQLMKELAE